MWQQLINDVGVVWVVGVLLLTAGILGLGFALYFLFSRFLASLEANLEDLKEETGRLPLFRSDNLSHLVDYAGKRGCLELKQALEQMAEDSRIHYEGQWTPDPSERLNWRMLLGKQGSSWLLNPSMVSLPLLGGILVSFLAFVTAFSIHPSSFENIWMRTLALLPLLIGCLSLFVLMEARKQKLDRVDTKFDEVLVQLKRKLPVYDQAAETAALLKTFAQYDRQMTSAARQLSDRVDALASQELTDAITNAVKYVMAATIAPPIQKSTDALNLLALQLEKKLTDGENQIINLYARLEKSQQEQADYWLNRSRDITESMLQLQHKALQEITDISQGSWQKLTEQMDRLIQNLTASQKALQETLLSDQKQSFESIRQINESVLSQMQTQYLQTIDEQGSRQTSALNEIQARMTESVQKNEETIDHLADTLETTLRDNLQSLLSNQQNLLESIDQNISASLSFISNSQVENLTSLNEHLTSVLSDIGKTQQVLQEKQEAFQTRLSDQQLTAWENLRQSQKDLILEIQTHLFDSLGQIESAQSKALSVFNEMQLKAMEQLSRQQDEGVRVLLDHLSDQIGGVLGQYLDPVTTRLQASAEALIDAQDKAKMVQDQMALQHQQAIRLEENIRDVLARFVETRKIMMDDLTAMQESARSMSESAASMSAVYAGSQEGLVEAISAMSERMKELSESLTAILSDSAEQTQRLQAQANETLEISQQHLDSVKNQVDILSSDLSGRIDQLLVGFSNLTADLMKNVQSAISDQNNELGGGLRTLTELMGEEARSISLYAQQIDMDIAELSGSLSDSVSRFSEGIQLELSSVLNRFDELTAEILRRLSVATAELGDAVENLPNVLRFEQRSPAEDDKKE